MKWRKVLSIRQIEILNEKQSNKTKIKRIIKYKGFLTKISMVFIIIFSLAGVVFFVKSIFFNNLLDKDKFNVGDYIIFGKYYDEPILWRCMKHDENGFLLVSKYIICLKAFDSAESGKVKEGNDDIERYGSNKWENSNIREWLNSNKTKVEYNSQVPIKEALWEGYNAYANEKGFLTNFSDKDIRKIRIYNHDVVNDKIFLLSKEELESIWENENDRIKCLTKEAVENSNFKSKDIKANGKHWYWLRTPSHSNPSDVVSVYPYGGLDNVGDYVYYGYRGIVPALYLKSNICKSGKGTQKDPYTI